DSLFRLESLRPSSAYDLAYPMAVLARQEPFRHLRSSAVQIVSESLPKSVTVGTPTPTSGRIWHLLGMVRVMEELPAADIPAPWLAHLKEESVRLLAQQRSDGMWTGAEIRRGNPPELVLALVLAAAFASAVRLGHLDDTFRATARRTLLTAEKNLTADGYLMVGSPSDPLGADGVVLSPMAAGLLAQLLAALPD
ncbi:MAG TPA: hypothetical protein VK968_10185, partial [Roseimicrobium sp.]|nr:hypothetical protein [Roseimicrobium sp.]